MRNEKKVVDPTPLPIDPSDPPIHLKNDHLFHRNNHVPPYHPQPRNTYLLKQPESRFCCTPTPNQLSVTILKLHHPTDRPFRVNTDFEIPSKNTAAAVG